MGTQKYNPQKEYIEKVKTIAINPLKVANSYFKQETNTYSPGKRVSVGTYTLNDYITVASNQIVFELDARAYNTNYKLAKQIIEVLDDRGYPYYVFSTGGKGIHIECWFDKPKFTSNKTKRMFKKALSYNISFKDIRFWLWNEILNDAGIRNDIRGIGKTVDSSCLSFDDLNDKSRLLRIAGGRKHIQKLEIDDKLTFYKTHIPITEFNARKINLTAFDKVKYPSKLEAFNINETEFLAFLNNFITKSEALHVEQLKKVDLSTKNGYIGLESVKRILEGLAPGQRSLGAQILAIAMSNDNLTIAQQNTIMEEYVSKCEQLGTPFTIEEAMGWVNWIQTQPDIFWNCSLVENAGLHDSLNCDVCQEKHKDAIKLLHKSNILDIVKDVLDAEVIGESDIKMLMFLLLLSKNFPSPTGKPDGWTILPGDPISQNIILAADSAIGKSYLTKCILEITGEKNVDYFVVSRITKSVLNYYTEENMDGKTLFIEEMQGLDEHTSQLRVWMSEGELNLETVEKITQKDGTEKNTKIKRTTKGQPVFISNQAEGKIEEQLNNRSWVFGLDASETQTAAILDYQCNVDQGAISNKHEINKRLIKDALKHLKMYHFIIPFANYKCMEIPFKDIRVRRDLKKFMTLIKCSAYLHQLQREKVTINGHEFLVCDIKDYEIARKYASGVLGATFSGLTNAQITLINYLKKSTFNQEFEIMDIMRNLGKTQPHWYGQLQQLVDLGYITVNKTPGQANIYTLNLNKTVNLISLPSGEELLKNINIYNKKHNIKPIPISGHSNIVENNKEGRYSDSERHLYHLKEDAVTSQNSEGGVIIQNREHERAIFRSSKEENSEKIQDFGNTPAKDILQYIKTCENPWVEIVDILEKYPDTYKIITELVKDGVLYERNGKVVAL